MRDAEEKVLRKIDETQVVNLTRRIARVLSQTGHEEEMAEVFVDELKSLGFQTEILEVTRHRPNVIARLKGSKEGYSLLFNGHLDGGRKTPLPGWTKEPYGGELCDGKIYGEFVRDMKGGNAAMLMAMNALKEADLELKGDVTLALTIGHAEHGLGVEQLVEKKVTSDLAIIGEPTQMNVCITHRAWIDMELTTRGLPTAYHTTTADKGVNAIEKMSKLIVAMNGVKWKRPKVPTEVERLYPNQTCYWNIGTVEGGFEGWNSKSIVPNYCKAGLNVRPMYGKDYDEMLGEMNEIIAQVKSSDPNVEATLDYVPGFPLDYLYIPSSSPLVKASSESIRHGNGKAPDLVKYDWTTDGGILQRRAKMKVVVWGPCEALYTPLGPDEFITVKELMGATKSYALAATKISTRNKHDFDRAYK
ncbi:MAG: M20/M25/M40 family metallo-hydrolase [Thaumarchaeota archaeon]|nr:M20/M25/M40 family metallo-hydrolase [Nitrososphaerota archaeon]